MATDQIVGLTLKVDQGHNDGTGQLSSGRATRRDRYSRSGFRVLEPIFRESYSIAGTDIPVVGLGFGEPVFRQSYSQKSTFQEWLLGLEPVFRESYSQGPTLQQWV